MFAAGEKVELTHPCGRKSGAIVLSDTDLSMRSIRIFGAYDKGQGKFLLTDGIGSRVIPLFYKTAYGADNYMARYQKLKDVGLPVPRTMRKINDDVVGMTDYAEQGAIFFGKGMLNAIVTYDFFEEAKKHLDKIPEYALQGFLDAYIHLRQINRMLKTYEQLATSNRIQLPLDDYYELVVYPDKRWRIMMFDLHLVDVDPAEGADLHGINESCSSGTIDNINRMYEWLRKNKPQALQLVSWWQRIDLSLFLLGLDR